MPALPTLQLDRLAPLVSLHCGCPCYSLEVILRSYLLTFQTLHGLASDCIFELPSLYQSAHKPVSCYYYSLNKQKERFVIWAPQPALQTYKISIKIYLKCFLTI